MRNEKEMIIIRGGGDLATGIIHRLHRCGYPLLVLEMTAPSAIRRSVAFSEAVYDGTAVVEGVRCRRIQKPSQWREVFELGGIPLLVDETGDAIQCLKPKIVVDAIIAKKNLGTSRDMAPLTIGLGPGFVAGEDVDYVVETMRGHDLGRIIQKGTALANTGVPGVIGGYSAQRVIHAPASGVIQNVSKIGDLVTKDQVIARIFLENQEETKVLATLTGVLRGIIRDGYGVKKGLKIADIDPRAEQQKNCVTISDKARCLAGSVLEIILHEGY